MDKRSRRSPSKDKKEIGQVANIGRPKRRRRSNAMSTAKKRDNMLCATGKEGRNPDTCFLCEPTAVKVVTDEPMEEILKLSGKEGRLAKLAAKIRTYDISYIPRKEAEGSVVKKFFGQGEQAKSTLTPRAWRLYLSKETIEEGSGVGIILVSPEERMHSYAIRLKFNTSDHAIDCEALLAGLAVSVSKGMKDLHVFMDSPRLVAQTEGNHTPATKQEKKYKKEIMDATAPFHRFQITHLLKILNSKAEVLTGLATIKLEFLNQEVSVGIKTRPSMEETSSSKKGKATSNVPSAKPNYNWEVSGSN
ncbi:reverse transcriptase domain-containing protein [Tanacetum coccineum]